MPAPTRLDSSRYSDVLQLLRDCERTYAAKIRLSTVPRPRTGYSEGCIILATAYDTSGKKLAEIESEQHLWPTNSHRTREGLEMYLLYQLIEKLDEREALRAREAQMEDTTSLTPLEQYIARQF